MQVGEQFGGKQNSGSYFDPIAYELYFCTFSDKSYEPQIMSAFRRMVDVLKPYIFAMVRRRPEKCDIHIDSWGTKELLVSCDFSDSMGPPPWKMGYGLYKAPDFLRPLPPGIDWLETRWQEATAGWGEDVCAKVRPTACNAYGSVTTISLQCAREYLGPSTEWKKKTRDSQLWWNEYTKNGNEEAQLAACREQIPLIFRCPGDYLEGVRQHKRHLKSGHLDIRYIVWDTTYDVKDDQSLPVIADRPEAEAKAAKFKHLLGIRLPRYLLDSDARGFPHQQEWIREATRLCEAFPYSVASMKMDAMHNGIVHFSIPDFFEHGKVYMAEKISGYVWGMWLTKAQKEMLGGIEGIRSSGVFYDVKEQKGGGIYLQVTDNVCYLPKVVNDRLYAYLKPYLVPAKPCMFDYFYVSYRMSFAPEDVIVTSGKPQYITLKS